MDNDGGAYANEHLPFAEVGLMDKLGRTPLHRSAGLGYGAATKLLVITTEDNDGRTARDLAKVQTV